MMIEVGSAMANWMTRVAKIPAMRRANGLLAGALAAGLPGTGVPAGSGVSGPLRMAPSVADAETVPARAGR